jgi:hypothetical protein
LIFDSYAGLYLLPLDSIKDAFSEKLLHPEHSTDFFLKTIPSLMTYLPQIAHLPSGPFSPILIGKTSSNYII